MLSIYSKQYKLNVHQSNHSEQNSNFHTFNTVRVIRQRSDSLQCETEGRETGARDGESHTSHLNI